MQTTPEKKTASAPSSLILEQINPLTLDAAQIKRYREAKKNAFMAYHQNSRPLQNLNFKPENYYTAFAQVLEKFEKYPQNMVMFSARDAFTHSVLGGLLGEKITVDFLDHRQAKEFLSIIYLFVEPQAQQRGVGTALVNFFIAYAQEKPLILAVRADHAAARRVYEKCGFTLITEPLKADGRATKAVQLLLTGPGYTFEDFVAYIYTPKTASDSLFIHSHAASESHTSSYT